MALFAVPGHQREPESGRGRDIDGIGPSDTEPPGDPGRRARENVVHLDEAKRRQAQR